MAAWTTIEVRANRSKLNGSPSSGFIRIKPSPTEITHIPSNVVIVPVDGERKPLVNGQTTFTLPATDDPDMNPNGFTYQIFEEIDGKALPVYSIELPLELEEDGLDLTVVGVPNNPGNYISLVTRAEFNTLSDTVDDLELQAGGDIEWDDVVNKPSTFPPATHTHDDRYYTEAELDAFLALKSDTSHTHDSRYYTETEINTFLSTIDGDLTAVETGLTQKVNTDTVKTTPGQVPALKITRNYDPLSSDTNLGEIFTGVSPDSTNWTFRWNESGLIRLHTAEHQTWDAMLRLFRRDSQTGNAFELVTNDGNTILCNIMPDGSFVTSGIVKPGSFTTAGRPSAVTAGERAVIYDTDLDRLCISDGTQWLETMVVTPWTTITSFATNKTADGTRTPQGTKRGDFTELCGRVNTSDGFTQGATVFTLPSSLWPAQNVRRDVSVSTGVVVTVQINSADGTVVYNGSTAGAATYMHLDGIKWRNY